MNQYQNLTILATKLKSALDDFFVRRFRYVVNFPMPGQDERTRFRKPLLELNPSDPLDLTFALKKAIKLSGLTLAEIASAMKDYGVDITVSALSHSINRGTIRFQRALQILAVCWVD